MPRGSRTPSWLSITSIQWRVPVNGARQPKIPDESESTRNRIFCSRMRAVAAISCAEVSAPSATAVVSVL